MASGARALVAVAVMCLCVAIAPHSSVGARTPALPFGCLGVQQPAKARWLGASQTFSPIGQVGTKLRSTNTDAAFGRQFAKVVRHGLTVTSTSRYGLHGSSGCAYGHDVVLGSSAGAVAYAAVAQLRSVYSLNQLMNVFTFVHPPKGFVQFATGSGSGYVTCAGVTKHGLLITANTASVTGAFNFSGWPTTMFSTLVAPKVAAPLTIKQLTSYVASLGATTQ